MTNQAKSELVIDGFGSSTGGEFYNVNINGRGKILSSMNCTHFFCNGVAHIDGKLHAEKAEINGVLTTEDNIEANELNVYGKTTVHGHIIGDAIRIEGDFTGKENCEAEQFMSRGRVHLGGLLNAESIQMTLFGTCRLKEIGGKTIQIKRGLKDMQFIMQLFSPLAPKLISEVIEGDNIHLEYTHAEVVRGINVSIGPGCNIEKIEYEQSFHQDTDAKVGHAEKT